MATTELAAGAVLRIDATKPGLSLYFDGRPPLAIHPLWLRERCRDPASMDARTEQRLYNPADLDPDLTVAGVSALSENRLAIRFSDGHEAVFSADAILSELRENDVPSPLPWTGRLDDIPVFQWVDAPPPSRLYEMVTQFLTLGFVILKGVPSEDRAVLTVARIFGFPRETNFGVLFDVRSTPDAEDLAYTSLALDPHTDNPYRAPVPGIQLLHCLTNRTAGGLSTLVDGLAVAEALQAEEPEAFAVLRHVPVRFRYADSGVELVATEPLIACDADGRFHAIHFSPRLDFVPLLPLDELSAFYRARRILDGMLRSDRFALRFKLDDGHLMMFDNRRLLHGRTGFDSAEGLRHLQGCYIDIDGPRSLYRILHGQLRDGSGR